jgi:hypothetical protein
MLLFQVAPKLPDGDQQERDREYKAENVGAERTLTGVARAEAVMNFLICGCDPRWRRDALVPFLGLETATKASRPQRSRCDKVHDSF